MKNRYGRRMLAMRGTAALVALMPLQSTGTGLTTPALLDSGMVEMRAGRLAQARGYVSRASQSDPTSPAVRLTQALLARQESEAVKLLSSVAVDTTAPDSLRAVACDRLGGLAILKRNYAEASWQTARACSLFDTPDRRIRRFHAALAAGELDAARQQADAILQGDSAVGLYCLGLLSERQRATANAYTAYTSAIDRLNPSSPYYLAALAGSAVCADRLGYVSLAAQHRVELERIDRNCLERSLFSQGFVPFGNAPAPATQRRTSGSPAERNAVPNTAERYTIQVGSFAAPANAERLAQHLKQHLSDVRVEETRVGDATHYRVRIGSFADRDEAERFGKERVSRLGITYKVLREL